jgi:hypothetical protein
MLLLALWISMKTSDFLTRGRNSINMQKPPLTGGKDRDKDLVKSCLKAREIGQTRGKSGK